MTLADSQLDPRQLRKLRSLLAPPVRGDNLILVVAAAAFFAVAALALAVTVLLVPPVITLTHVPAVMRGQQ